MNNAENTNNKGKKLLFIMNPKAGTMQAAKYLADIIQIFCDAGFLTTVMMTAKSGDGREFAAEYAGVYDIVACAGGDGTLNEVIDGVMASGSGCSIGYIPAGSTNDFAVSVGIPRGILDAARLIVSGTPGTFDVGSFNGRHFSYVASFGAFTSTSYSVPQNMKNMLGHTAYVLRGVRDLIGIKSVKAKITTEEGTSNEKVYEGNYLFGAVCNSTSVAGILKLNSFDVDMNDGMMELLLIKMPGNIIELNEMVVSLLDGSLKASNIEFISAKSITVRMEKETHWTLDGEYEKGGREIRIDTIRSAIRLIV